MSELMHSINNYLTCALSMYVQQENCNFSRFSRLKRDSPSAMGDGELTFLSRNSYLLSSLNRLKSCHRPPVFNRGQFTWFYMLSNVNWPLLDTRRAVTDLTFLTNSKDISSYSERLALQLPQLMASLFSTFIVENIEKLQFFRSTNKTYHVLGNY